MRVIISKRYEVDNLISCRAVDTDIPWQRVDQVYGCVLGLTRVDPVFLIVAGLKVAAPLEGGDKELAPETGVVRSAEHRVHNSFVGNGEGLGKGSVGHCCCGLGCFLVADNEGLLSELGEIGSVESEGVCLG